MIAKLAYLTTPSPGRYMLNLQIYGSEEFIRVEIARCHLVNILVDGTAVALREDQYSSRVPSTPTESVA
jgi:hypothetical protein